jgi:cellulose synthase/poly-beta-1,6-N-acetylglucosamine synthase-like glycosyltransferase
VKDFYPSLAALYDIPYFREFPVLIDPVQAVIQQIPLQLLIEYMVYPFEQDGKLVLALSNPFIDKEHIREICSYTSYKEATYVFSHPNTVKQALLRAHQKVCHIVSEDYVGVFQPISSAKRFVLMLGTFRIVTALVVLSVIIATIISWYWTLIVAFTTINLAYFIINPVKFYTFYRSFISQKLIQITPRQISETAYARYPRYTILVPLKGEASVIPQLLSNIEDMSYPKDKIDIKFAVEIDDEETVGAIEAHGVNRVSDDAHVHDYNMQLVFVPIGEISTKPRSCNFALTFARGLYTVIYDAEDKPDTDQLQKAYLGFMETPLNTVCLQAKLNFYNSRKNLLTRFFSLEYGLWFEYFVPGLGEVRSAIPLGGTSNHFVTAMLKRIGRWDPYNVTEDADLGLRIAKNKFHTAVLDSHTLEEATSELGNWIRQRTRWQKGFILTFFVHIKNPRIMYEKLGLYGFFMAFLAFGINFIMPFVNPYLWVLFIWTLFFPFALDIPYIIWLIGMANFIIGNSVYIFLHALSAVQHKRYDLVLLSVLMPFYWMLISVATYRAVWQFIFDPYKWEKTRHGS